MVMGLGSIISHLWHETEPPGNVHHLCPSFMGIYIVLQLQKKSVVEDTGCISDATTASG